MAEAKHKPKIVLVGGDGRPSGVPRHVVHLVKALHEEMNITVISDQDQGGYTDLLQFGVRHVVVPGLTNRLSLPHLWSGLQGLIRALNAQKPDLIWIHARLPVLMIRLMMALRLWRPVCPVAFTHHGMPYGRGYHPMVHAICKWLEKMLVATCPSQDLIFLNHRMAGWMARDTRAVRLARHRVHILPNCSDLQPLPSHCDETVRRLVMTGRTGRQKDYDFAARLLNALPDHYRLTLCGPGTESTAFQTHIAGLVPAEVFSRMTFTGPLPNVRAALQSADAYLLTSRYEGTPIGALEAFEAGLPIILRDFDGANDLISKHPCGLVIGKDDLRTDANRIEALIDRYQQDKTAISRQIKDVWKSTWSPEIFAFNARALVKAILNSPIPYAPDCGHDVQGQRPDHRKNAAARVPKPQP